MHEIDHPRSKIMQAAQLDGAIFSLAPNKAISADAKSRAAD